MINGYPSVNDIVFHVHNSKQKTQQSEYLEIWTIEILTSSFVYQPVTLLVTDGRSVSLDFECKTHTKWNWKIGEK